MKFDYKKWYNETDTVRRRQLKEMREDDVRYIIQHSEIPLKEVASMPDSMVSDLAYDLRFTIED